MSENEKTKIENCPVCGGPALPHRTKGYCDLIKKGRKYDDAQLQHRITVERMQQRIETLRQQRDEAVRLLGEQYPGTRSSKPFINQEWAREILTKGKT